MNRAAGSGPLEQVERLIRQNWKRRWQTLSDHPVLIHPSVARLCNAHDPLLATAVRRTAMVGLDQARSESSRRAGRVADRGSTTRGLAGRPPREVLRRHPTKRCRQLHFELLRHSSGVSKRDVAEVMRLLRSTRRELRKALEEPRPRCRRLTVAASAVEAQDQAFAVLGKRPAADLVAVIERASDAGVEPAMRELRLIRRARKARRGLDRGDDALGLAMKYLHRLVLWSAKRSSRWVSVEAARLACAAVPAVPAHHPHRSDWLDIAASAVTEALTNAPDVISTIDLTAAVAWSEEALACADHPADRMHLANNLGYRISLAVQQAAMPRKLCFGPLQYTEKHWSWPRPAQPPTVSGRPTSHPGSARLSSPINCWPTNYARASHCSARPWPAARGPIRTGRCCSSI
ncbi:hypothetical protein [Kribbella ginsengisoli]|uniref:Transposase n=1 Tax=Kribbella ginsengisoli TaxID=363865 RepID=A0ABP6VKS3_9ACTN